MKSQGQSVRLPVAIYSDTMVGAKAAPLHPFRIVIERKISVLRGIQKKKTSAIYPLRTSL